MLMLIDANVNFMFLLTGPQNQTFITEGCKQRAKVCRFLEIFR